MEVFERNGSTIGARLAVYEKLVTDAGATTWEELALGAELNRAVFLKVTIENTSTPMLARFDDLKIEVFNAPTAMVVQENSYYPFGLNMRGLDYIQTPAKEDKFQYNGKEKQSDFGLNWSDYGARNYDFGDNRWWSIDPLAEKYYSLSPYVFVANNPIKYIDPDGNDVKPANNNALDVIKSTLPKEAREYVVINPKTGFIDKSILMKYENKDGSSNFSSLLSLVEKEDIVVVSVTTGKYELAPLVIGNQNIPDNTNYGDIRPMTEEEKRNGLNGDPDYNLSTGEGGDLGGNIPKSMSKTGNLEVVVNSKLSKAGQVEVMAHELYGHAYLELNNPNNPEISNHDIDKKNRKDNNNTLKQQIIKSVNEAKTNYEQN